MYIYLYPMTNDLQLDFNYFFTSIPAAVVHLGNYKRNATDWVAYRKIEIYFSHSEGWEDHDLGTVQFLNSISGDRPPPALQMAISCSVFT